MKKFAGFPRGKLNSTALPSYFFSNLLPLIDDLAELKLTLFSFWALHQRNGDYRFLRRDDFVRSETLVRDLEQLDPNRDVIELFDEALKRAIERKTLLAVDVVLVEESETIYFLNTERGRTAVEKIRAGVWQPTASRQMVEILEERPTIYALYESNIGVLVPLVIDELKDAENEYPYEWIQEAFELAIHRNARNWAYIRRVLQNWKQEGKEREVTSGNPQKHGKWNANSKFAKYRPKAP